MKRWILIVLLAHGLIGCKKEQQASSAAADSVSVRFGFFPNLTHAQAVLGADSGEFASAIAPSKLISRQFNAGPSLIEALFAREIDIGYVGPGPAITGFARSHGQGLRVISGAASNGVVIVARKDSGINSMSDLAGKKIATPQQANTQDIAARHFLTALYKQTDTKNVLPVPNAEQAAMMGRGDIDATWAPEPWGSLLIASAGAKLIGEEKDLWPDHQFSLTVIITTPEFLKSHPDIVEKILRVNHSWTERLSDDPQKYVPQLEDALAKLTGKRLPAGVTASALAHVKFSDAIVPGTFENNAQWSFDLGFSKEKPNLDGLIDQTILEKISNSK